MARTGDIIALVLGGAVVAAVASTYKSAAAAPSPPPPSTCKITPEQRAEFTRLMALSNAEIIAQSGRTAAEAAALLRLAAASARDDGCTAEADALEQKATELAGAAPPPVNPLEAQALAYADKLIETARTQAPTMNPEGREGLAKSLETAADSLALTSPTAAARLIAEAARLRRMNPATTTPQLPMATPEMLYEGLLQRAEEYVSGASMGMTNRETLLRELTSLTDVFRRSTEPGSLARAAVLASYAAAVQNPQGTAIFATRL